MRQEHASFEDLDEDCPSDPLTDVSEILDGCNSLWSQLCPLLEILHGQLVQDMLFASQEPQEVEVRLGPSADDGVWGRLEGAHAAPRSILEEPEAPLSRATNGDLPQTTPGDALDKVGAKGLILQTRGSDGHVRRAPSDVGQATVPYIAWVEVLEVAVDARGALVLTSTVSSASHDIIDIEAHTSQLLLKDTADIAALLARTVADVSEHGGAPNGRR